MNTRLRLPDIARSLKPWPPTWCFLQEVQGRHSARPSFADWPAEAQHQYLARQLHARATYGLNCAHEHGHHGNAILSRLPVEHWCNRIFRSTALNRAACCQRFSPARLAQRADRAVCAP